MIELIDRVYIEGAMRFGRSHLETVEMKIGKATGAPSNTSGLRRWHGGNGQTRLPLGRSA